MENSFKLFFRDGNVPVRKCRIWWDDNPLATVKNGDIIERGEGERFDLTVIKDGYKSKILFETAKLNKSAILTTDLEPIVYKKYIFVTPYLHSRQLYTYGKSSTPVKWQQISETEIEVVPSNNYITEKRNSRRFEILFDSSSKVSMSLTKGIKQYLTNYTHKREFILSEDIEPENGVFGTITITNKEKCVFTIKVVEQLSE